MAATRKTKKEKEVVGIYISGHPLDDYKLEFEFFVNTSLKDIPESNQRELRIAGIVSKTQTRTSKTGNPFALFTLEDFDGTIDLALFGKDYFTYKNFIETQAAMLYITGEMKPSYRNPQEMEFKIKSIELLSDIKEKLAKNLVIHLDSKAISPRVIDDLKKVFESSPGKTPVKIKITENTEDITLNVYSKKFLISPTNELFLRLREMEEVKARLN
jgi:DNA polymerase-3 subunit alpha